MFDGLFSGVQQMSQTSVSAMECSRVSMPEKGSPQMQAASCTSLSWGARVESPCLALDLNAV